MLDFKKLPSTNDGNRGYGFSILSIAQLALILLKLTDMIQLTWVQVFIPLYINIGLLVLALILLGIATFLQQKL